jgi:hypothetical protein
MLIELMLWLHLTQRPDDRYPHLPPAADLDRFPQRQECADQRTLWREHAEYLQKVADAWPENQAQVELWKTKAEHAAFLWEVLAEATAARDWTDEETKRLRLDRYKHWVGDEAYRTYYTPPRLPPEAFYWHSPPERVPHAPKEQDG